MISLLVAILSGAIVYAVSVLYAGIGETFTERSGVMNLGVEGVMLMGAMSGAYAAVKTQSLGIAMLVVLLTGAVLGLIFAFLTVTLQSDQTGEEPVPAGSAPDNRRRASAQDRHPSVPYDDGDQYEELLCRSGCGCSG